MSKKLLSTLIASLFVAAPALAQSDDPMRVEGSATIGGIYNDQNASDTAKLQEYQDLGNGALSSFGAQGRSSNDLVRGLRREHRPRRPVHVPARRHVRRLQVRRVPQRDAAQLLEQRDHAVQRRGRQHACGDVPAAQPGRWNSFDLGYERQDDGGYFEWQKNSPWYFRVDGNQVKFDGTKVGSASLRHEPRQRLHRAADPGPDHHDQLRRRRRLPDEQGDVRAALGLQQVQQRRRRSSTGRTRSSVDRSATCSTRRTSRRTTPSTSSRRPATTATCRGARWSRRATPTRRRRATPTSPRRR